MGIFEQIRTLEKNIAEQHAPAILFAMNQKYRELKEVLESKEHIDNIEVKL